MAKGPAKLLLSWDIKSNMEQDFFEFNQRSLQPELERLGIEPIEAWYTIFGSQPNFMVECVTDSFDSMFTILDSEAWDDLQGELLNYVDNLQQKVVHARGGFQF